MRATPLYPPLRGSAPPPTGNPGLELIYRCFCLDVFLWNLSLDLYVFMRCFTSLCYLLTPLGDNTFFMLEYLIIFYLFDA